MYKPRSAQYRQKLRSLIEDKYPGKSVDEIFDLLKAEGEDYLSNERFESFFEEAGIPAEEKGNVYGPYGIKENGITRKQFEEFFAHDFFPKNNTKPCTDPILTQFVAILVQRAGTKFSSLWEYCVKWNPTGSDPKSLRVSALCHIYETCTMTQPVEEFINALFSFIGSKVSSITTEQFQQLVLQ